MQSNKWSIAAQNALILALVTILATLLQAVFPQMPGFIGILIWTVKLVLSIYLVYYFIKDYSKHFETFTFKDYRCIVLKDGEGYVYHPFSILRGEKWIL